MPNESPLFLAETAKTCLKHTYLQPDPRATMRALARLDYALADIAAPIFRQLIAARAAHAERPLQVMELGCAYGIGTALLRFPLSFATLQARYTARELQALDSIDLEELDRLFYAAWPRADRHRYVGVDGREHAVAYAHRVGAVESGMCADLERAEPDEALAAELLRTDVIVSCGRIGARTAARLTAVVSRHEPPWIACFMNRASGIDELAATLAPLGLVTERFEGTSFAQRRFESAAEKERALSVLRELGIDPAGKEAEGWLHAELYVARPAHVAAAISLPRMITIARHTPRPLRYPLSA